MRWLRTPLAPLRRRRRRALLAGARAAPLVAAHAQAAAPIVVTAADVARLRTDYTRETGLEPTADDEAALVDKAVDEELLFREAVARGLDRNDRSVRNWLVEQMHVLERRPRRATPTRLYARAPRARPRPQRPRRPPHPRAEDAAPRARAPTSGRRATPTLEAFYAAHRDDYRAPDARHLLARVRVVGRARRSAGARDARRCSTRSRTAARPPADAVRRGRLVPGAAARRRAVAGAGREALRPGVRRGVAARRAARWIGPVVSPYGAHLVWVERATRARRRRSRRCGAGSLERWQDEQRAARVARAAARPAATLSAAGRVERVAGAERDREPRVACAASRRVALAADVVPVAGAARARARSRVARAARDGARASSTSAGARPALRLPGADVRPVLPARCRRDRRAARPSEAATT